MKVGIVGGIGPESTVDYYKSIISEYQKIYRDDNYPQIIIDSINMKEMLSYVVDKDWDSLANMLSESIISLSNSGATFAAIASNTPHVVFERVKEASPIPLLSIVEEACNKAREMNFTKLGLLGTAFTMKENFYKDIFSKHSMEIALPNLAEQEYIHTKLFSEIELGIIKEDTRGGLISIINRMIEDEKVDCIILGCTELPLILKDGDCSVPFLNTVEVHVESIVKKMIGK